MLIVFSTTIVLSVFYIVFSSQIFLMSIYFPEKLRRRVEYVLDNFPPDRYPKLYPSTAPGRAAERLRSGLRLYRAVNYGIAILGLIVLFAMALSNYRPDLKGGDEIFVLAYFMLQACPLLYVSLKEMRMHQLMREAYSSSTRKAPLAPRRLFDFVSPTAVASAVLLYAVWLVTYLADKGFGTSWEPEVYLTLVTMTGTNLLFAGVIARYLYGKKPDPYQAYKDQLKQIGAIAEVMVFTSIGISLFSIVTIAADRYSLEVFDPPLTSLYLQFCAVAGIGYMMRLLKIDSIDFEVYREDVVQTSN